MVKEARVEQLRADCVTTPPPADARPADARHEDDGELHVDFVDLDDPGDLIDRE